jgi:galactokinase
MQEVEKLFRQAFGAASAAGAKAPGRLELLGNHTDYNQGFVMALAVDRFISFAASPRADRRVTLVSGAFPERVSFGIDAIAKDPAAPWADYVKGLLKELRDRGAPLGGFDAAIHSTIPLGGGLSSSAALLVSTALAVRKLFPYRLLAGGSSEPLEGGPEGQLPTLDDAEKLELAKLCQAAENKFVGVQCGLLDHVCSLFGQADHTVLIDFLELTVASTPFSHDLAIVVCPSGVKHELVGGEYNERRALCEAAARKMGVTSLRHVTLAGLEASRTKLSEREYGCAAHVVGENDRVQRGAALLRRGELRDFGQLLYRSHRSSRELFWNSCPELDTLVELAAQQRGCVGARLTGGGFGGATLNLVERQHVDGFQRHMITGYRQRTGRELDPLVCQAVDGAG